MNKMKLGKSGHFQKYKINLTKRKNRNYQELCFTHLR